MSIGDYSNIIMQGKRDSIANAGRIGSGVAAMGKQFGQWNTNRQIKDELNRHGEAANPQMAVMGSTSPAIENPPAEAAAPVSQEPDWGKIEELVRQGETKGYKTMFSSAELEQRKAAEAKASNSLAAILNGVGWHDAIESGDEKRIQNALFKAMERGLSSTEIATLRDVGYNTLRKDKSDTMNTYKQYHKDYGQLANMIDETFKIADSDTSPDEKEAALKRMNSGMFAAITKTMAGSTVTNAEQANILNMLLSSEDAKALNAEIDKAKNLDTDTIRKEIDKIASAPTNILANPLRIAAIAAKAQTVGIDTRSVDGHINNAIQEKIQNIPTEKIVQASMRLIPNNYRTVRAKAALEESDEPLDYSKLKISQKNQGPIKVEESVGKPGDLP